jgi:GTP-binding protein
VDGTQEDVAGAYRTIRAELAAYGHGLADKPEIVALNKVDALTPEDAKARAAALAAAAGTDTVLRLSGVSGAGMEILLSVVLGHVIAARAARAEAQTATAEPIGYAP